MADYAASFGIGFLAGLRSLSACAALTWAASPGRPRGGPIPAGPVARAVTTTAALAEMAGDKMPFAPDRRIPPSFAARLAIGALGGWMLAGRRASPESGALVGVAGAVAGTLLGRAARGPGTPAPAGLVRGFAEDAVAAGLAMALAAPWRSPTRRRPARSTSTPA